MWQTILWLQVFFTASHSSEDVSWAVNLANAKTAQRQSPTAQKRNRFVTEKQTESASNTSISQLIQSVQWWKQQIRVELYPRFDAERYFRYNQDQLVTGKIKYHQIYPTLRSLHVIKSTSDSRNRHSEFHRSSIWRLCCFYCLPFTFPPDFLREPCFLELFPSFCLDVSPAARGSSGSNTSFTYFLHLQKKPCGDFQGTDADFSPRNRGKQCIKLCALWMLPSYRKWN